MPSISYKSKIRTVTDSCTLTMVIEHRLFVGQPSDTVVHLKHLPPRDLDIFLVSNLLITISGTLNTVEISSKKIEDSHITRHLLEYLRMNAGELGINMASSSSHISEDTGLLTLTYTGSRPFPSDVEFWANLVAFNIRYVWQTKNKPSTGGLLDEAYLDTEMNPFSSNLSLPYLTVVNNAVERFITYQVVKRYPLIFGYWGKQLDIETTFFPSIYASIQSIVNRSPHSDFVDTCKKLLKLSERGIETSRSTAFDAVSDWIGRAETLRCPDRFSDSKMAFMFAMNRVYQMEMKRQQFKGLSVVGDFSNKEALLDLVSQDMDNSSKVFPKQLETNSPEKVFDALDIQDGYTSSDLDLSLDCETGLGSQLEPPCLGLESSHHGSKACDSDFWLSDASSDLDYDEDLHDFSQSLPGPLIVDEEPQKQSTSEGSTRDHLPIHNTLVPFSRCGWSPDMNASQEKVILSPLGMVSSQDSRSFPEIDLDSLNAIPGLIACLEPTLGKDYVEEDLFCDSLFDHFVESELMDHHGVMNNEDDCASLSFVSGKEEHKPWLPTSLKDSLLVEGYLDENFELSVASPDRCNFEFGHDSMQKGSHCAHTNDVPEFLIMEFD